MPLRIIFAGTPEFAVPTLEALLNSPHEIIAVYTQPDRPAGRGQKIKESAVKIIAKTHDIPIQQPLSLKNPDEQQALAELKPDVMIVVAYGMILPPEVLAIPRLGCINIHPSLLPRWRGAAPIQRAILAGDRETGVTIMQMDKGLDSGPILSQIHYPLSNETSAELHDRLAMIGAELLLDSLTQLEHAEISAKPQDPTHVTYAAKISKTEAMIDWNRSATEINDQVRGLNPWPIAHTAWNGEALKIWQAEVLTENSDALPGTILRVNKQGLDIACNKSVLRILKVQLPGGRPISMTDFMNAHLKHLIPGKKL
jgi:methionyl-tRNA formyltransferase